ncbi:MAG: hypothetical protein COU66_04180 [Candidatus Pacebacteria bacterium CG10_big_fil_rev_8_21_14_0_10_44_11]|nr:MAG: hypothetical protein COU66_04180 [Candidatus Pacebacteria bacterium CG10_big_fil_rev_8_21_14_0_10_44_11]
MIPLYLGIDGGGTKTEVLCLSETGETVGTGLSGPTNLTSTNTGAASFSLKEAVRQALEKASPDSQVVSAVMGLAGMDTQSEYEMAFQPFAEMLKTAFKIENFHLVHDSVIALENGSNKPNAVVLISGTGSICVGRNDQGDSARSGGMDYLLTDQGSGYDIGRHVLREAIKSFDGRRPKTMLEQLVCQHFEIENLENIKMQIYHPPLSKVEVAELAKVCCEAYLANDSAARQILEWAQTEMIKLVEAVVHRLGLEHKPTDLVLSGSIIQLEFMRLPVIARLQAQFSALTPVVPDRPSMYGAAQLAKRLTFEAKR